MDGYVVRLRGLPWAANEKEIVKFFDGITISNGGDAIYIKLSKEGRSTGEAFVEFVSERDVQMALDRNMSNIGSRYIEAVYPAIGTVDNVTSVLRVSVFRAKKSEMDWVLDLCGPDRGDIEDAVVKLRGLPFDCSKEEILQFFTGLQIAPNGIMLPEDHLGRMTGEAFVQFTSHDIAEKALGKHKDRIGHRYIEIFKSCLSEVQAVTGINRGGFRQNRGMGRPGPYDRRDRYGDGLGMRGGRGGRGFSRERSGVNVKGYYEDEFRDFHGGESSSRWQGNFDRGGFRGDQADFRGDQSDFRGNQADFRGDQSDFRGDQADFRGDQSDFRGDQANFRGDQSDFRGDQSDFRGDQADFHGNRGDFRGRDFYVSGENDYISKSHGHCVHMRGLPFQADEHDIFEFFAPVRPIRVTFQYFRRDRPTGMADVQFATHQDALDVMHKDKANMNHRYIELFLNSSPNSDTGLGYRSHNVNSEMGPGVMGDDFDEPFEAVNRNFIGNMADHNSLGRGQSMSGGARVGGGVGSGNSNGGLCDAEIDMCMMRSGVDACDMGIGGDFGGFGNDDIGARDAFGGFMGFGTGCGGGFKNHGDHYDNQGPCDVLGDGEYNMMNCQAPGNRKNYGMGGGSSGPYRNMGNSSSMNSRLYNPSHAAY